MPTAAGAKISVAARSWGFYFRPDRIAAVAEWATTIFTEVLAMVHPSRFRIAVAVSALSLFTLAACQSITDVASPSSHGLSPRFATIPPQGTATSLDIGNWNIEWFGDPSNGPANDALQESNVKDVS